jgi:hypothetical protein
MGDLRSLLEIVVPPLRTQAEEPVVMAADKLTGAALDLDPALLPTLAVEDSVPPEVVSNPTKMAAVRATLATLRMVAPNPSAA